MQRDKLLQEITILQAMVMKDKSNLPHYLKYRDRGFMYFPNVSFVPLLQKHSQNCLASCEHKLTGRRHN